MKNYSINYENSKIIVTKAFLKEAGIYNSEAYNTLKAIRADFPDFKVEQKEIKKNSSKRTYGKLTYDRMKEYIQLVDGENAEMLKEFDKITKTAQFKSSPYAFTKKWFFEQYPNFAGEVSQENDETASKKMAA